MKLVMCTILLLSIYLGGIFGASRIYPGKSQVQLNSSPGQAVYISEGCIHCHSQYSRALGKDSHIWGPESLLPKEKPGPVLIGNRRQGPDLSNVGLRRSREWNRLHLIAPGDIVHGSRMPSYRHLFENGNEFMGEALLDYLESLASRDPDVWNEHIYSWEPALDFSFGNPERGRKSFLENCVQCHGKDGRGTGPASSFMDRPVRNLVEDPFLFAGESADGPSSRRRLAQIVKFGQPGTSMPGHECLSDEEIIDLLAYLARLRNNYQ